MKYFLFLAAFLLTGVAVEADNYNYLMFQTTGGATTYLNAAGTKIVFTNGQLVATSGTESATFNLSELSYMVFTTSKDGSTNSISNIETASYGVHAADGSIVISGNGSQNVSICNVSGALVAKGMTSGGTTTFGDNLAAGVYIVKVNGQTSKIVVK